MKRQIGTGGYQPSTFGVGVELSCDGTRIVLRSIHWHCPAVGLQKAKGLLLEGDCDPRLSEVVSDSTKLRQITHNLLSNAVKYTAQGRVHFSLRAVDDTRWSFIVEDTGPGIASKDRERLFVEFHRAKNTAHLEGTGLGLAIVKQLVDLLGGDIRVESLTGCGSRFEVTLPQCSEALSAAPVAS